MKIEKGGGGRDHRGVKPVYFSGSISGGREDVEIYVAIVEALRQRGVEVVAGEVTNRGLTHGGESKPPREIFARDVGWIADVAKRGGILVAEVSRPSAGVGYEIGCARYLHQMPVICLWRPAYSVRCTAMIAGDPEITFLEYDERNLLQTVDIVAAKIASFGE